MRCTERNQQIYFDSATVSCQQLFQDKRFCQQPALAVGNESYRFVLFLSSVEELAQAIHCEWDQRRLVKRGRIILKGIKIIAPHPGIVLGHSLDDARHAEPRTPAITKDPMDKYDE